MRGLAAPEYKNNIAFQNGYNNDIIATLNSKFGQAVEQTKNVKFSGGNLTEKGRAIWNYLKNSVQYRKDDRGKQVIQLPSRMLIDTKKGDCKSLALAAASFMQSNGFKNVRLRYTSYSKTDKTPTHVYAVGADENGNDIIIDPVYKQFNKELSYTFKQDYPMQISVLSGINQPTPVVKKVAVRRDPVELAKKLLISGKVKAGGFFYNILLNFISRRSGKVNYPSYTAEQLKRYRSALNKLAPKNAFLSSLLEEEKQLLDRGTFVGNIITKYSSSEINGVNEEIGRLSLKKIKKGLKKISIKNIVKGVKTVGLVAPRKAFLALTALNVRGLATRMSKLSTGDLEGLWVKKFGGKLSVLQGAIAKGKNKKPLFGASKKVKSIKGIGYVVSDMDTIGAEPATGATTATIIAAASPILVAVIALLKRRKVNVPELVTAAAASAGALAENSDFAEANPAAAEAISKYTDYATKAVSTAQKLGIIPDAPETPAETAVNKAIPEDDHTETAGTTMGTGFKLNPLILVGAAAGAYFLFGRKK
jgi:hypothetical protein